MQLKTETEEEEKYKQKLAVKMEAERNEAPPIVETNQDFRVQVTSKRKVAELINRFKEILSSALDGQPDISEETRRNLLQDLLDVSPFTIRLISGHL